MAAQPPITPAEQDLVSDFGHLGLAVRSSEDDDPKVGIDGAAIAARVAYAKHSNETAGGENGTPQLHRSPDIEDLREAQAHDRDTARRASGNDQYPHEPSGVYSERSEQGDNSQRIPTSDPREDIALSRSRAVQQGAQSLSPRSDLHQGKETQLPENPDTKDVKVAKAVTHETIKRQNLEIRQEVITKDVHDYHEVTKILPVVEKVVLPARHFIEKQDGRKVEIPASEVEAYKAAELKAVAASLIAKPQSAGVNYTVHETIK